MEVVYSPLALRDLGNIKSYIGQFNPSAAERIHARLVIATQRLAERPLIGRPTKNGRRELSFVPPYVIVYRIESDRVLILRIWHSAQNR